jgi:hypothetical protein
MSIWAEPYAIASAGSFVTRLRRAGAKSSDVFRNERWRSGNGDGQNPDLPVILKAVLG